MAFCAVSGRHCSIKRNDYFAAGRHSHLSSDQYEAYLKSVLSYNEAKAVTDTALYEGKIEGETTKAIEIATTMLAEGFDQDTITKITKLTTKEIAALK